MKPLVWSNRFPGGKRHALTLSYDDGRTGDRRLVGLLDRYGLRGTFCLNSGMLGKEGYVTPEELPHLYRNHEVAAHTVHHPDLTTLDPAQQWEEVWQDCQTLERYWGHQVRGFSYPYGRETAEVAQLLARCGLVYARTVASTGTFSTPTDLLRWHPTCRHREGLVERTEAFLGQAEGEESLLFFLWGHSYEFDRDHNWDLMEWFCAQVAGRADTWYATNGALADYLQAQGQLEGTEEGIVNPTGRTLWVAVDGKTVPIAGKSRFPWAER